MPRGMPRNATRDAVKYIQRGMPRIATRDAANGPPAGQKKPPLRIGNEGIT